MTNGSKWPHTVRVRWDVDSGRLEFWSDGMMAYPDTLDLTIEPDADGVPVISLSVEKRFEPDRYIFRADKSTDKG